MPTKEGQRRTRGGGIMLAGLREARQDAGLTLRELSEASGVPLATISKLELGRRGAVGKTTRALAQALGVEVRELRQAR